MNYRLKLALSCLLVGVTAAPAFGANLLEVYQRAQQADPSIREADATRLAAREAKPQAWAALLPQLEGGASKSRTDQEQSGQQFLGIFDDGTPIISPSSTTDTTRESDGWSVSLSMSVFRWDQWVALKRADAQVAQAEANYRAAEQDLIFRVAQRYFNVLAAQDSLNATNAAAEAFTRQLEQSEKRFEVGLIAITDVQEARAARDRATADQISAKRVLATNIELLREITGDEVANLAAPRDDMPLKSPDPATEDRWVSAALEQNLSLLSARLSSEIAARNVSIARAGHLPSLRLSGSHSDSETDTTTTTATRGTYETQGGTKQDQITLSLTVPIFSGGATQSGVRQQVYTHRATRERVERVTRETERAARDNYLGVISNISRVQALKQAFESSRTALQATEAGFDVGTRTTVDVLLSRQTLYSAQTSYERSKYDYILSVIALKQAAGSLTPQDVAEINSWLQ
jgi:outer membrane protein